MSSKEFLSSQKILRLATIDSSGNPHLVPVWYMYTKNKFYVGTNSKTRKVRNIKKAFGDKVVLEDVSAIMQPGKTNLIIGTSGSGKTVLSQSMILDIYCDCFSRVNIFHPL